MSKEKVKTVEVVVGAFAAFGVLLIAFCEGMKED